MPTPNDYRSRLLTPAKMNGIVACNYLFIVGIGGVRHAATKSAHQGMKPLRPGDEKGKWNGLLREV